MAYHAIIIAGFGGQGIMLTGQIIAAAAVIEGKNATWLPSYGPEMRGGTANCTVIVDEKPITSPVVDHPTEVIAMNFPSMMKFGAKLRSGGLLLVNSSVVEQIIDRGDIETIEIPANEIAEEVGNVKAANMVMLGAFLELTGVVSFEAAEEAIREKLSKTREDLLKIDLIAIKKGREFIGSLYHKSS